MKKILFTAFAAAFILVACESKTQTGVTDTTKVDTTKVDTLVKKDTVKTADTVKTVKTSFKKDTVTKK